MVELQMIVLKSSPVQCMRQNFFQTGKARLAEDAKTVDHFVRAPVSMSLA